LHIDGNEYITFADAHPEIKQDDRFIARYGRRVGSSLLYNLGVNNMSRDVAVNTHHPYRFLKSLVDNDYDKSEVISGKEIKNIYYNSIDVMIQSSHTSDKKLLFAIKGGHNKENHNHNDLGSFVLYNHGEPVFIDAGVGTYTRKTFDSVARYKIWTMQSSYHNLPEINGFMQEYGEQYLAENVVYDKSERSLYMNIEKAYPQSAGVKFYTRKAVFEDERVTITDCYELLENGKVVFNFLLADCPDISQQGIVGLPSGLLMKYDSTFVANVEEIKLTDPAISKAWKRESFFRLRLICEGERSKTTQFVIE